MALYIHKLQRRRCPENVPGGNDVLPYGYKRAEVIGGLINSVALVSLSAYVSRVTEAGRPGGKGWGGGGRCMKTSVLLASLSVWVCESRDGGGEDGGGRGEGRCMSSCLLVLLTVH